MGVVAYGKEGGWSFIHDFLNSPERGNGRYINNKISYDTFDAGSHIARENTTWNGIGKIGQPAEVTYSFPTWKVCTKMDSVIKDYRDLMQISRHRHAYHYSRGLMWQILNLLK